MPAQCGHNAAGSTPARHAPDSAPPPARPLYLARGMPLLRAVCRMKLFHLGAVASAAVAAGGLLTGSGDVALAGAPAGVDVTLAAASAVAAAGCAGAMTWLQTRWVGALAVKQSGTVRLSTLDARGRRVDVDLPPGAIIPPLAGLSPVDARRALATGPAVLAFDVEGGKQFLIAPRSAAFVDARGLAAVLAGRAVEDGDGEADGCEKT